jgi:hypothetical protein
MPNVITEMSPMTGMEVFVALINNVRESEMIIRVVMLNNFPNRKLMKDNSAVPIVAKSKAFKNQNGRSMAS